MPPKESVYRLPSPVKDKTQLTKKSADKQIPSKLTPQRSFEGFPRKIDLDASKSKGKPVTCKICIKTQVEIQCNMCKSCYHGKCDKIPKLSFQALIADEGLHYICNLCKPVSDTWGQFTSMFPMKMETVENAVAAMQIQVDSVDSRVSILESNLIFKDPTEFKSAVNDEFDTALGQAKIVLKAESDTALEQAKSELKAEARDVASRRKNFFIQGLDPPADNDDKALVVKLAQEVNIDIGINDIKRTFRIKPQPGSSSKHLLNVECGSEDTKDKFLDQSVRLKLISLVPSSQFHGVMLFGDKTIQERKDYRTLSAEKKEKKRQFDLSRNHR